MNVVLMAHTQVTHEFRQVMDMLAFGKRAEATDGQAVALTAIRTCYSANKPSDILKLEGEKYFGEKGKEAERLMKHIFKSKHLSTTEHISFTFAVEGVSRALLAQLTRQRVGFSYSVQSQRYVRMGSDDKIGGFDYVVPDGLSDKWGEMPDGSGQYNAKTLFEQAMGLSQELYDGLRKAGVPAEDARAVLPNAAATNLVLTVNVRSLLDFYSKRKPGSGAQKEISILAERLKEEVVKVEPWLRPFFEGEA